MQGVVRVQGVVRCDRSGLAQRDTRAPLPRYSRAQTPEADCVNGGDEKEKETGIEARKEGTNGDGFTGGVG